LLIISTAYAMVYDNPAVTGVKGYLHSVLKLFTGFAMAALTDWILMVHDVIKIAAIPADKKTHHSMVTRKA